MLIVLFAAFFVRIYIFSPGEVTEEYSKNFWSNRPTCYGIHFVLPLDGIDAHRKALCIGLIKYIKR